MRATYVLPLGYVIGLIRHIYGVRTIISLAAATTSANCLLSSQPVSRSLILIMTADTETYGFPAGYFIIRSIACNRVLDVTQDDIEDGTEIVLWPEKETSLVESAGVCISSAQDQ